EQLKKKRNSPIYAFYHPVLDIGYHEGRCYHEFKCVATGCKKGVRRFLDKKDAKSMSNMWKHAKICWGEETVKLADETKNSQEAHTIISGAKDDSITASFKRTGKGKVTYSHRQHTRTETKAEIVWWVAESLQPFMIVKDCGFQSLIKPGRPEYYIPSPLTVLRDIKLVFAHIRQ
ncbi:hypothetical protein EDD22DRAFT_789750, partial [Suillus occidentalis]